MTKEQIAIELAKIVIQAQLKHIPAKLFSQESVKIYKEILALLDK